VSFRQGVDGYAGAVDTRLYESFPDTDYSAATSVWTDYADASNLDSQFLLRFDDIIGNGVSQVPFGATIHAAVLTLASVDSSAQGDGGSFHTMLTPWSDTDTWNTLNGGATTDDVQASSTYNFQAGRPERDPNVQGGFNPFDVTADVQAWVNGQANYGWAALPWEGGTDGWGIATSEASLAQHRPELRIYFTAGPGVTLDPIANLTASEDGATAEFNVVLNSTPSSDVTITVGGDSQVEVSADGVNFSSTAVLTFTAANAQTAQTVTVRAIDDAVVEGKHVGSVSMTAVSADADYDAAPIQDVEVAILDNETLNVEQVVINDGSAQRSMVTQMSVVFNAGVVIAADAFQVINRDTQDVVNTTFTTSLDGQGRTVATITFLDGPSVQSRSAGYALLDGNYQLKVSASKVTFNGLELEGDEEGGDYFFGEKAVDNFFRFYGDTVGTNRSVNLPDFAAFRSSYGSTTGSEKYRNEFDFDDSGAINLADFAAFRARYGKILDFDE
jgi:hypothetical protein